ncbi:MAG: hypothetical protein CMM74_12945 [Rhodospirillaceae bacterium]|nr:hypothetical protein [Rhodospirillaceae bacterium]
MTALNILSVGGFLLFVGLAARHLVAALSQRGVADRIHKIALIGEILIVSVSGFLALIGCYAPIYLLMASALAYLVSRRIGPRYAYIEPKPPRVRRLDPEVASRPDSWSSFAFVFVGTAAFMVLAWNVRNDFFSSEKRMIIGDDAAYHVPTVLNLERHRSLWFPLENYQIDVPEIGVHGGNDARIFFPLNHELLVALARFASGPAVEFMRVINYLLMFHLILVTYCLVKLVAESNATAWLIALACFLLPVFQGRLLRGQISVFGNLNNDLFVALLVLSGIYLAVEQWRDLEAGSSAPRSHPNTLLLGAIILVAVGTKWYAALYSVVLLILFITPIVIYRCWRDHNAIKLTLTLCLVGVVTNGAAVRNLFYFGTLSGHFGPIKPFGFIMLSMGRSFVEIGELVLWTAVTHGSGLTIVFPLFGIIQVLCHRRTIGCEQPTNPATVARPQQVDLGVLLSLIGSTILILLFAIPQPTSGINTDNDRIVFGITIRYAMPAWVLAQCTVVNLRPLARVGSQTSEVIVPMGVCLSVISSLFMYFLPVHVAVLVALSLGAGVVGVISQRVRYERLRVQY